MYIFFVIYYVPLASTANCCYQVAQSMCYLCQKLQRDKYYMQILLMDEIFAALLAEPE